MVKPLLNARDVYLLLGIESGILLKRLGFIIFWVMKYKNGKEEANFSLQNAKQNTKRLA